MTGYLPHPPGSAGRFASLTAPGGGTNSPRIVLVSAAARCLGVLASCLLTAEVAADIVARDAEVASPQLTASIVVRMRKNGPFFVVAHRLDASPP